MGNRTILEYDAGQQILGCIINTHKLNNLSAYWRKDYPYFNLVCFFTLQAKQVFIYVYSFTQSSKMIRITNCTIMFTHIVLDLNFFSAHHFINLVFFFSLSLFLSLFFFFISSFNDLFFLTVRLKNQRYSSSHH